MFRWLAAVALVSGCSVMDQQSAEAGKTQLVGKTKSAIIACLGVPDRTYTEGDSEYLAYAANGRTRGGMVANRSGNTVIMSGGSRQSQCVVNFGFQQGTITTVTYRSTGGRWQAPDEACGELVRLCL